MADNFTQGGKIQIVFLVDVFVKEQNISTQDLENVIDVKSRAISLCVLRLLLHFNSAIDCGNFASFKWGFKFYNSNVLNFEYKRRRFYELSSESFEQFEEELRTRFTNACSSQKSAKSSTTAGVRSLSCSITEILHDFPWITPDIRSPSRSTKSEKFNDHGNTYRNYLFVIGDCPMLDVDLYQFLGRNKDASCDTEVVFKEIFSTALYEEFCHKCGLSLFWIDSGLWCVDPQKQDTSIEDWKGYHLISYITKQLGGNIIPISSLVQDTKNLQTPSLQNQVSSPGSLRQKVKTLAEVRVLAATLRFSFGKIVEAFLNGQDSIGGNSMFNLKSVVNCNGLLRGTLSFQGKTVCSVVLSHILKKKLSSSDSPKDKWDSNSKTPRRDEFVVKSADDKETMPSNDSSITMRQMRRRDSDVKTSNGIDLPTSTDIEIETETEKQISENCFVIKGVIASNVVSPSWMHPTKLYSCFSTENSDRIDDGSTSEVAKHVGVFEQLLSLASGKYLSIVVEYQDPDTGTFVTGLLQPMTSLCAILSMIKNDKLLLVEKALLRHKLRGYTLVPCDVTSGEGNSKMLPFDLRECKEECGLEEGGSSDSLGAELSKSKQGLGIVDSYICSFQKKRTTKAKQQEENGLHLKLKEYYSKKKSALNSEKSVAPSQTFTRGKLLQETSQRNKTLKLSESEPQNNAVDSAMETEDSNGILSNLDSEQTDVMDEDPPDMSVIQSIDDLKENLKDEYKRCLDHEQSVSSCVIRTFQMIEHFKNSGQLKEISDIDDLLRSTVLRDSKNPRKNSDEEDNELKKETILLEYKLQVFLRLEFADKIGVNDEEKIADEITSFLRPISFQKDPAYLSSFLKSSVIPKYAGNLSGLLCQVYDGLMQRPPKEILSPSQVTSEEDTPLKSCKTLSSSKKAKSVEEAHSESSQSSRTLVRRHSVVGVPVQRREIVIPGKGKSDKTRKKVGSVGKRSGKKSSKIKKPVTPVKKVRRNLFEGNASKSSPKKQSKKDGPSKSGRGTIARRHSIAAFTKSKTVADTPVGKQVSQRMLRRQEWARRRSKAVIDVTVVGESPDKDNSVLPRKSPRQKPATFYSASQRASSTTRTTNKNLSTSTEISNQHKIDKLSVQSINTDTGTDTVSSQKKKYTKLVNINESSPHELSKDDSFTEVFLEPADQNEKSILSACTSERKGDIASGQAVVPEDPNLPLSNTKNTKRDKTIKCPSSITPKKSRTPTVATVHSRRSVSQRSNSSPSLSTTPPEKSSKSPFTSHKSFPTTSPVLFKTPKKTPKSSPINFSPDQIFDIAIPLTPVKCLQIKPRKTDSAKKSKLGTSPFKKVDKEITPSSETVHRQSGCVVGDSKGVETRSEDVGWKSENIENDSESVVAASPLLNRIRSLISSTKAFKSEKPLNLENNNSSRANRIHSDLKRNDVTDDANEFSTVSDVEVQRPEVEKDVEILDCPTAVAPEQGEMFKSPVTTKRKRIMLSRTGNVSPLNQILKQRKNNRNTSPGTPRGEMCKTEKTEKTPNSSNRESKIEETYVRKARKRKTEEDDSQEDETGTQLDESSLSISDDILCPNKRNLTPTRQQKHTNPAYSSCNLKAHFTPSSLSAGSLKHLQESPVLLGTSLQFTDSRARKWSERKSPLTTSRLSLRKRVRHDS